MGRAGQARRLIEQKKKAKKRKLKNGFAARARLDDELYEDWKKYNEEKVAEHKARGIV